jgi:hypothetical protein
MPFEERQSPPVRPAPASEPRSTRQNRQETLTVLARIDREDELRSTLSALRPEIFASPELAIHFARLAVVPRDASRSDSSAWLVLESNFDTPLDGADAARAAHLDALAGRPPEDLAALFACCTCCEGLSGQASPAALAAFWKAHLLPATATYQGHGERDLARIRLEQRLREVVLTFFETVDRASPQELFERVRKHVRAEAADDPLLAGLDVDGPAPALPDPAVRSQYLRENWAPWLKNAKLHDVIPVALRIPEALLDWDRRDVVYDVRGHQEKWTAADRREFSAIAATEDHGTQNALTHVVPLRRGRGRLAVLKHAHAVVNRISQNYFQYIGQLGKIPSIHFAKWVLFESDQRLLFLSNYDKSWESYLGDFVDKAPEGLNLAWSCTQEYPRTVAFAFEGAKDEETFKSWSRAYQVPTQVFYSAYTDLTIEVINNNTWIRHRLHQPASAGGLDTWFRRLT